MDATNGIQRGQVRQTQNFTPEIESFDMPQVKYNIPQEYLQESPQPFVNSYAPVENTKPVGTPTVDAIKGSKLPDEIKRLMIEHPINQPQQPQVTLSNDLIERASRLMKTNNESIPEQVKPKQTQQISQSTIDYNVIQKMIVEAVESVMRKNGMITESTEKTNDNFTFKVGKHIFEGKVTKVKKIS